MVWKVYRSELSGLEHRQIVDDGVSGRVVSLDCYWNLGVTERSSVCPGVLE